MGSKLGNNLKRPAQITDVTDVTVQHGWRSKHNENQDQSLKSAISLALDQGFKQGLQSFGH